MMTRWNNEVLLGCSLALLLLAAGDCLAGQPVRTKKHSATPIDRLHRAGNPQHVAWWARPSLNKHYISYYVGGGAVIGGEHRGHDEGTWGLDYGGVLFPKRVWLQWWHGRKEQDGGGTYKTDGPKLELE